MFRPIAQNRWFIYAITALIVVGGFLWWQVEQDSIDADTAGATDSLIYVSKKPPAQNSSTTLIASNDFDTSKWLTYRNEKYGFEMKYPAALTMEPDTAQMDFHIYDSNYKIPEGAVGVEIRGGFREIRISVRQKSEDWFERAQGNMRVVSEEYLNTFAEESMIIGGENAVVYTYVNPGAEEMDATVANSRYVFYFQSYQLDLTKDILSTIKFFEPKTQ